MTGIRLVVTAGLLWILTLRVDVAQAASLVSRSSALPLIASVVVLAATALINALRWRAVLASGTDPPTTLTLFKITLVGLFFNQVLPTGVGGDAVRAWRCQKLGIRLGVAIRSILLERASGYSVFLVLYALGLPVLLRAMPNVQQTSVIIAVLAGASGGLAMLFILDRVPSFTSRFSLMASLADLSRDARRVCSDLPRFAMIMGLSGLGVGLTVLSFKLLGESVKIELSYAQWLVIVPLVALIQLAPVSLAGWGVREATMVVVLAAFGVPYENALATSLLFGLCQIAVALPGGLIWLTAWDLENPGARRTAVAAEPIKPASASKLAAEERKA